MTKSQSDQIDQKYRLQIRTADELVTSFDELREPIIDGLIRRGEVGNVIAAPKMGKSWLVLFMGISVGTGSRLFGRFETRPGRVLIIDNELHRETSASRLKAVSEAMRLNPSDLGDRLSIVNLRGQLMDYHRLVEFLIRDVNPGEYDLLILDASYRFQPEGTDENSNADATRIYNLLDHVASVLNVAILVVHHTSKGNQSSKSITDTGAGAGAQSRAADTHIVLREHQQEGVVVVSSVTRSFPPGEDFCIRRVHPIFEADDDLDATKMKRDARKSPRSNAEVANEAERLEQDRLIKVLSILESHPQGETKSQLAHLAGMNAKTYSSSHQSLFDSGYIEECKVQKSRNKPFDGIRITSDGMEALRQLRQLRQKSDCVGLSDKDTTHTPTTLSP